jgi:hypothetical protein
MRRIGAEQVGRVSRQVQLEPQDICERCGCARVADDDDGGHWKTVRGRRVCRTCVFELVLAAAQTEQWWTRQVTRGIAS